MRIARLLRRRPPRQRRPGDLYTLPRYTARVEFASLLVRPADIIYVSVLFASDYAKYWYGTCVVGWALGLIVQRGHPRVLVMAGVVSFASLFAYATAFLFMQPDWWLPLPIYIEQCMWPLFTAAGVAGPTCRCRPKPVAVAHWA